MNEPFGRQPRPITVRLEGEPEDVAYWRRELMQRAEFKGDLVQTMGHDSHSFRIFPRAVND